MVQSISEHDFDRMVAKNDKPVLIDFWAPWCVPCRMTGPVVEQFAQKHAGQMDVFKINVDENQEIAQEYDIMGIPTMIAFTNGKAAKTIVGFHPLNELERELGAFLKQPAGRH